MCYVRFKCSVTDQLHLDEYFAIHSLSFSTRHIFLLVVDLSKEVNLSYVYRWLMGLKLEVAYPSVLVVGRI